MYNSAVDIKKFATSAMGPDFHIELFPFQTQSRDPFEKKTKNRLDLRKALYNFLKDKKNFAFEDVLDLRNVPQKIPVPGMDLYGSLSHTDTIGVFALDSLPVGVDFEDRTRVQKVLVERVCKAPEMKLNSNFQLLWSIKEASFKSIPFIVQPKTITDITVTSIAIIADSKIPNLQLARFSANITKSAFSKVEGVCIFSDNQQLAIAKAK